MEPEVSLPHLQIPSPVTILSTDTWMQPEMEGFSVYTSMWTQLDFLIRISIGIKGHY